MTLDELAVYHGTDKGSRNVCGLKAKHYAEVYERLFRTWRNEPIRLLEIGIKKGASLRMWRDWFSQAHIVGLDIDILTANHTPAGTTAIIGSQADVAALERAVAYLAARADGPDHKLDIVIDDGSHRASDQIASFNFLWERLNKGGIYAVEDLRASPAMVTYLNGTGFRVHYHCDDQLAVLHKP